MRTVKPEPVRSFETQFQESQGLTSSKYLGRSRCSNGDGTPVARTTETSSTNSWNGWARTAQTKEVDSITLPTGLSAMISLTTLRFILVATTLTKKLPTNAKRASLSAPPSNTLKTYSSTPTGKIERPISQVNISISLLKPPICVETILCRLCSRNDEPRHGTRRGDFKSQVQSLSHRINHHLCKVHRSNL